METLHTNQLMLPAIIDIGEMELLVSIPMMITNLTSTTIIKKFQIPSTTLIRKRKKLKVLEGRKELRKFHSILLIIEMRQSYQEIILVHHNGGQVQT